MKAIMGKRVSFCLVFLFNVHRYSGNFFVNSNSSLNVTQLATDKNRSWGFMGAGEASKRPEKQKQLGTASV